MLDRSELGQGYAMPGIALGVLAHQALAHEGADRGARGLGFSRECRANDLIDALVVVCIYIAGFSLSWGPVVWVMLAEIFPNSIRDKAMAIAVAAQWFMNWVVSVTFNIMDGSSALNASFNHGFAYWLYGGFSVLAALFVWKFVPESKGVTLEAMQKLWKKGAAPAAA